MAVRFQIVGTLGQIEPIARGAGVRARGRLHKAYGTGRWRKMKGVATILLEDGAMLRAELHWYEAHGIGRQEFKIKRFLP